MPTPITDIDKAIEEMQYIADKSVIEEMQKADPQARRKMFEDFWKKKDPTPSTDYNELMDEYYARVEYANKTFKHFSEGWKTDRGMVYIIFGPPSSVERRPFDIDSKPYEVWTYYEINREFVFIDQSGFGDYRLQNPIWDTWDTRYK
jgi:GWxTD domain-containing protein